MRTVGKATRLPRALPLAVREDQYVHEARELLVFLPGVFDVVEDYQAHGFLQAVRETGRAVDILLVDAHLGYYAARTVLERLRQAVISPTRARYESIRLIGVSMGDWAPAVRGSVSCQPSAHDANRLTVRAVQRYAIPGPARVGIDRRSGSWVSRESRCP